MSWSHPGALLVQAMYPGHQPAREKVHEGHPQAFHPWQAVMLPGLQSVRNGTTV
jgi:hypothetical protein